MHNVHAFPAPPRRPGVVTTANRPRSPRANQPDLPATAGRFGEYALGDVARPLGLRHKSPRAIIEALRALARHDGMPLPRTPRVHSGNVIRGPRSIMKSSRWDAGEFDAWLDGRGPSPATAAAASPAMREGMRERAALIAGGRR